MITKLAVWLQSATSSRVDARDGQGMVEYALILVLVALACIAGVALLGDQVLVLANIIEDIIGTALLRR